MSDASRLGDNHTCPLHGGGPVQTPLSPDVLINGLPAARATDQAFCAPVMDFIVTGASTVFINGLPAARRTDKTMHGGIIISGAGDVIIGGPAQGVTLGDPDGWLQIFVQAAQGRTSNSMKQSYQNCGVESARQILLAAGNEITEGDLLDWAVDEGLAEDAPDPLERGGTNPQDRQDILNQQGIPSSLKPATQQEVAQAVAEKKGVISSHDAGKLWGDPSYNNSGHAVSVTGVSYDANGNISDVIISDTGTGDGRRSVPAAQYFGSLRPGRALNVTGDAVK
jgi:uncharacterized Zn-binding protein involved in type VI secretion